MVLAKDTANRYLVYRFGTKDKIDFTFPDKIGNPDEAKQSRNKFKYSFYIRGGEKQNEGLDLNYVYFSNGKFKYVIYQTYSANESESRCGIKIIDLATKKTIDIKGKIESIRRDLKDLRDSSLLEIGDELFD